MKVGPSANFERTSQTKGSTDALDGKEPGMNATSAGTAPVQLTRELAIRHGATVGSIAVTIGWFRGLGTDFGHRICRGRGVSVTLRVPLFCCRERDTHPLSDRHRLRPCVGSRDVAALYRCIENAFGVFHALAVVSPVTIAVGLSPLLLWQELAAGHRYTRVLHDLSLVR
jgi:hypothetical protein